MRTKFSMCLFMAAFMLSAANVSVATIDTGLGIGNGGAVINSTEGGFVNLTTASGTANLNFNADTHVNWDTFNINSNQTMNFNTVGNVSGITVLNTVNSNMSKVYGNINIAPGISNFILSNPNGMLFNGASFSAAADTDVTITTAPVNANFSNNGRINIGDLQLNNNSGSITISNLKYNNFFIDYDFYIIAPTVNFDNSVGFKLVTVDGENFIYKFEEDNSNIPINIGVEIEPWEDGGEIVVNDNVNDNPNNGSGNVEIEPWEDGGKIVVDYDVNSISVKNMQKNINSGVSAVDKTISELNSNLDDFDSNMVNKYANNNIVETTINYNIEPSPNTNKLNSIDLN